MHVIIRSAALALVTTIAPFAVAGPLRTADMDGDGHPDIIVHHGNHVRVYLNNGDGSLAAPILSPLGLNLNSPITMEAADKDGDGDIDIFTTYGYMLGDGSGSLTPLTLWPPEVSWPAEVLPDDFDGDGAMDALVVRGSAIFVLWGNGDGSMGPPQLYDDYLVIPDSVTWYVQPILVDMDGDGDRDIVVLWRQSLVIAYENLGSRNFTRRLIGPTSSDPGARFTVGDLNNDGLQDIIVVENSWGGRVFRTSLSVGQPWSFAPVIQTPYTSHFPPSRIVAGNLDDDAADEVLLLDNGDWTIFEDLAGSLVVRPQCDMPPTWEAALADFDGDGDIDVFTEIGGVPTLVRNLGKHLEVCDPPTGACCFACTPGGPLAPCPDDASVPSLCIDLTAYDCDHAHGQYRGDNTICAASDCVCVSDVNGDGRTNATDFAMLAAHFGQAPTACMTRIQGDLNCDGAVTTADFLVLAGDFGCGN